ncbi:MAG: ABC transporter ATP-binding protein [Xanthobacteraceae bacterium]
MASALAVLAATFEGAGLLLLVPLLSLITASDTGTGWTHRFLMQAFEIAGAQTRTARLSLLLGLFAGLVVIRAIIVARRNVTLARIEMGFIETVRARLAGRLAAAPWPVVSRLQHAGVTHLMSGDIHRVGTATHHIVQFAATLVIIGAQIVTAFLLAPLLTVVALILIAIGAGVGFVMLRRTHDFGARLSHMGIELMHETSQFLGGLKLSAAQNRQANFVAEFQDSLDRLKREQLAYLGQENRNRLAASIIAGLVGALIAFVGLVLFDVQAAVILTLLFIFSRISGPAMQMSQMLQQFARTVPAHAEFLRLERDLATQDAPDTRPAPAITPGAIVFRDVSFHYDRSSRAGAGIERLNLTIAPGTFLGVSGPTGAGKTTFADLLIGLIEPDSGEIAVGGVPLRGAAAIKWRDSVSYVVQDPYLFRDTIRRNLLWANPQASRRRDLGRARHCRCRRFRGRLDGRAGHRARRTRHAHFRRRAPAVVSCPRRAPPALPVRARRSDERDRRSGGAENHQGNARSQAPPDHRDDRASRSEPGFLRPHAAPAERQSRSR